MRPPILVAVAQATVVFAQYGAMNLPGLSPRYYLGNAALERRQSGNCASNAHSCLDVNATVCCPDTQYCFIDPDLSPKCCDIGSNCDSGCPSSQYQCASSTTIGGLATATIACCDRTCPSTSAFKCASGGGCCSYGSTCGSNGGCTPTATGTGSAVVTQVPAGCTTSQIACPTASGGGCCNVGLACTVVNSTNYCAGASGLSDSHAGKPGLSTGAKAGIGAGIAAVAIAIAAALLWFCLAQRRGARQSKHSSSAPAMSQEGGMGEANPKHSSDYFGAAAANGSYRDGNGFDRGVPATPQSPNDIAAPVEIDSRTQSNYPSPGAIEYLKAPETTAYPIELP